MKKKIILWHILCIVFLIFVYHAITVNKYEYRLFIYNNENNLDVIDTEGFNNREDCSNAGKMFDRPYECGYKCRMEYGRNACKETFE